MGKIKRYLILGAGALLIASGVLAAVFAFNHLLVAGKMTLLFDKVIDQILKLQVTSSDALNSYNMWLQVFVSLVMSSAVISIAFGAFAIRFAFYGSGEFQDKKSVLVTMAALFIIIAMPITVASALTSVLATDVSETLTLPIITIIVVALAGIMFMLSALFKDSNYVPQEDAVAEVDILEVKLTKLNDLKSKGLISDEEYTKLRDNILNS